MDKQMYVLFWKYFDGSGEGVLNRLLSDREAKLVGLLETEGMMDSAKEFKLVVMTVEDEVED